MRESKVFLGVLCKRGHDYEGTGQSLRYVSNPGSCVNCTSLRSKKWSSNNSEYHKKLKDDWYENHKQAHAAWKKQHRNRLDPFVKACLSAKGNAHRRKLNFNLTANYIKELWQQQEGKCHWLKIPLNFQVIRSHPLKATIDRLEPNKGYIKGNVAWACSFANLGRNKTSVEDFILFLNEFIPIKAS